MTTTIYLNMKTKYGIETVDSFSIEDNPTQTPKQFRQYVTEMQREYHMAGMPVYKSSRPTKERINK